MIKKLFFAILSLSLLLAPKASASEIVFSPTNASAIKGSLVKINVNIVPDGDRINAAEGKLIFPAEILSISKISYGNSLMSFWPEAPHESASGVISFSGVAPGGYESSSSALLFSVIFKANTVGEGTLDIRDGLVLRDDGMGSATNLTISPGAIAVSTEGKNNSASLDISSEIDSSADHEMPESFTPLVGASADIFGGKYFLVFSTVDKQSGLDHYEVEENVKRKLDDSKWILAESPYLLQDQTLHSFITVKAVDKAGNYRTETLLLGYPQKFYQTSWFFVIIIVTILALIYLWRKHRVRALP